MNLQETPEPTDEVSEQEGISLFVAPEVAEPLSDALVDVAQTPDGPQLELHRRDAAM
jgi:Fe-S cluster assembly iron-binding protein IscA